MRGRRAFALKILMREPIAKGRVVEGNGLVASVGQHDENLTGRRGESDVFREFAQERFDLAARVHFASLVGVRWRGGQVCAVVSGWEWGK